MKPQFRHSGRNPRHSSKSLYALLRAPLALLAVVAIFGGGILFAWATILAIPSIDNFQNRKVSESTKIYDRTRNVLLYDVHGTIDRKSTRLNSSHSSISYSAF